MASPAETSARDDRRESPTSDAGAGSIRPSSGHKRRWIIVIGGIVLVVAIAVGAYYYWQSRYYESTDDAYVEGHPVSISARVSGSIVAVHVTDNQHVPQDELLAEVDPRDYRIGLERAEAALRAARADEQKAAADVEAARATWVQQEQDRRRNEGLAQQGAVTEQALEHSRAAAATAQASLNAQEKNLASVQAQTAVAKVGVDAACLQLSYTQVRAPQAGYVTQKSVAVGAYVDVGQPLLVIVTDEMYVVANFKETQLTYMRPGQPVTIRVDAYPGVVLRGHIDSLQAGTGPTFSLFPPENATGNFVKIVQRVPVKIVFDEPPGPEHRLVLGLSVRPKVRIREPDQ